MLTGRQILLIDKAAKKVDLGSSLHMPSVEEFEATKEFARAAVREAFGDPSDELKRIDRSLSYPISPGSTSRNAQRRRKALDKAASVIRSIVEIHSELLTFDPDLQAGIERVAHASVRKVFVVHGHDDALRERVARFLERASLEPVILAEQPSGGNTIIEKLESNSDVAFAVVLLTGDDVGGVSADELLPRARQNVVFELGYFVGLLARKRVCALVEEGVEIFSDISGVTYISVDPAGAWKNQLAKELNAAELEIDLAALL